LSLHHNHHNPQRKFPIDISLFLEDHVAVHDVKLLERAGVTPEKICEWEKVAIKVCCFFFLSVFLFQSKSRLQKEVTPEITIFLGPLPVFLVTFGTT
jgi:hypothetical protein